MNEPLTKKERMKLDRIEMPERDAGERAASFEEVNLGLTAQMAQRIASSPTTCSSSIRSIRRWHRASSVASTSGDVTSPAEAR